jgi:hypothetical protein
MKESTKYEYLCGKITNDDYMIFSYIWFDSLADAKEYVKKRGMKIVGGWNE